MKKSDKKKPAYSVISNYMWTVKMLWKYSKTALIITVLFIPINIGLRYLEIYLPSLVVSEVTSSSTFERALISVGIVMLLIMVGYLITQVLGNIKNSSLGIYRYKMTDLLTRKQLSLFFQTYEKKEVRDLSQRATRATQMWDGVQPLNDMVNNGFGIIQNLLGYLLFGTVISFASPYCGTNCKHNCRTRLQQVGIFHSIRENGPEPKIRLCRTTAR